MRIRNGKIYRVTRSHSGHIRVEAVRVPVQPVATLIALGFALTAALAIGLGTGA